MMFTFGWQCSDKFVQQQFTSKWCATLASQYCPSSTFPWKACWKMIPFEFKAQKMCSQKIESWKIVLPKDISQLEVPCAPFFWGLKKLQALCRWLAAKFVVSPSYLASSKEESDDKVVCFSTWWFHMFFIFTPTGGNDPIRGAYFSDGLVKNSHLT